MANKKELKKSISKMCGEVASVCMYTDAHLNLDAAKVQEIIIKLAVLQESTRKNVSFSFDKTPKDFESRHHYALARTKYFKQAYKVLNSNYVKELQEIVKEINALIPNDIKAKMANL